MGNPKLTEPLLIWNKVTEMPEMSQVDRVTDAREICTLINAAAQIYRGIIPEDCWHEPYMSVKELHQELEDGVVFSGIYQEGELLAVMGFQVRGGVELIRHAYVSPQHQRTGMGRTLLRWIHRQASAPILVGTWAGASWAIRFYENNGYHLMNPGDTAQLLETFWRVPKRQAEASVVLARGQALAALRIAGEAQLGRITTADRIDSLD